jgi:hypothetical protein
MKYQNDKEVHIMMYERGKKQININVPKNIDIAIGDIICLGRKDLPETRLITIDKIIESRQSSMKDYNYVRAELVSNF